MKAAKAKIGRATKELKTLAIDIGGTGIKAIVLDEQGKPVTERGRLKTPKPATPRSVLAVIKTLAKQQGVFECQQTQFLLISFIVAEGMMGNFQVGNKMTIHK